MQEIVQITAVCAACRETFTPDRATTASTLYVDESTSVTGAESLLCADCEDDCHPCQQPRCANRCVADINGEVDGEFACPGCVDNAVLCDDCQNLTAEDADPNGPEYLCADCVRDNYTRCADCDRLVADNADDSGCNVNGELVCFRCAESYFYCDPCGETYHVDDYGGNGQCSSCYSEDDDCETISRSYMRFAHDGRTTRTYGIDRMFGVELEFSQSFGATEICEETGWGACPDGTAGVAQEFKSPPMSGDKGLESIERFCELAQDNENRVSSACGLHVHFNMRGEKELPLARIAAAYQAFLPLWQLFVPQSRRENHYCSRDRSYGTAESIATGKSKPHRNAGDRYCAVNWVAYSEHKTVEIRLHTGTVSARKVTSWVLAHLLFIDWARRTPFTSILDVQSMSLPDAWRMLAHTIWRDDSALVPFYRERARKFGTILDPIVPVPPPVRDTSLVRLSPLDPRWIVPSYDAIESARTIAYSRRWPFCGCGSDCIRRIANDPIRGELFADQWGDANPPTLIVPEECRIPGYRERLEDDA